MTKRSVPFIVGNWKMNGLAGSLAEAEAVSIALAPNGPRVGICPPATLLERMSRVVGGTGLELGGQDCSQQEAGAFTGDVSAAMLIDAGARLVILGHSERRTLHGETDADVAAKALAASNAGLEPIICVGESLAQRQAGEAEAIVAAQVAASVPAELAGREFAIAYEPVWAIGTGLTPSSADIVQMHGVIGRVLQDRLGRPAPILYGGSVKPSNAKEILALDGVGGALVGGASLKAADFLAIIQAV